jgi:hypothetical protein
VVSENQNIKGYVKLSRVDLQQVYTHIHLALIIMLKNSALDAIGHYPKPVELVLNFSGLRQHWGSSETQRKKHGHCWKPLADR